MTTTTTGAENAGTTESDVLAVQKREPRGDLARVRQEIASGLADLVTSAAHQGCMYVYDWLSDTSRGRSLPGQLSMLADAERCLKTGVQYLELLRRELVRCDTEWDQELPF